MLLTFKVFYLLTKNSLSDTIIPIKPFQEFIKDNIPAIQHHKRCQAWWPGPDYKAHISPGYRSLNIASLISRVLEAEITISGEVNTLKKPAILSFFSWAIVKEIKKGKKIYDRHQQANPDGPAESVMCPLGGLGYKKVWQKHGRGRPTPLILHN